MTAVQQNVSLLTYNTFRVSCVAKEFGEINSLSDLNLISEFANPFFLGQGANILFVKPEIEFVIKNNLKGKKVVEESDEEVLIEVASGEDWSDLVKWAVENDWSGIENLNYIPGTVAAAAVGNIAAYGQTVADVIVEVKTPVNSYKNVHCNFGYRESIFKKNREFVTSVTFKLNKTATFATDYHSRYSYESLKSFLPEGPLTPKIVAESVMKLRMTKLPDWHKIGTAGSFFKNPNVTFEKYQELARSVSELQCYPPNKLAYEDIKPGDLVKIPAARLLDELGWKGKRIGNVATHDKQALCVINLGGATGQEIYDYTLKMQESIKREYNLNLEPEVIIL